MDMNRICSCNFGLETSIRYEDIQRAKTLVNDLSREERKAAARYQFHGRCTLLGQVAAADMRYRPAFVKFLLEECHADVDQRFTYEELGNMTALCLATRRHRLGIKVVRLLVKHGADVNAAPDDQCTAVHSACGGDPRLVEYLVQHGADINIPDIYGETCLMRAMRHINHRSRLCRYLVGHGASVNAVDKFGQSALHYAADNEYAVRLLMYYGADASLRNQAGDDILQTAALYAARSSAVLDHLISELQPTQQRCADLYSLVAAQKVDEAGHFAGAVVFWKKSLSLSQVVPTPNPAYDGAVEAGDVQALAAISGNRDALRMQALICRERILGSSHRETIYWVSKRAMRYTLWDVTYQRGVELYRYATASSDATSPHTLRTVNQVKAFFEPDLFWSIRTLRIKHRQDATSVRFDDVAHVLRMTITRMTGCLSTSFSRMPHVPERVVEYAVDMLHLLCTIKSSEAETQALKQLVCDLVRSMRDARLCSWSLLHAAVQFDFQHCDEALVNVVEELLDAGADVNALDRGGNTPLQLVHYTPYRSPAARDAWLRLVDLLLRRGAHVDVRNAQGHTPDTRLSFYLDNFDQMQYITLQCLAARSIRSHGIEYRNILPATLADFTDHH